MNISSSKEMAERCWGPGMGMRTRGEGGGVGFAGVGGIGAGAGVGLPQAQETFLLWLLSQSILTTPLHVNWPMQLPTTHMVLSSVQPKFGLLVLAWQLPLASLRQVPRPPFASTLMICTCVSQHV